MLKELNYQTGRVLGKPIFEHYFHPQIIGREKLPKKGPILLCGNHLHVWDQFPVICSTKRTTHWMAKKEYFDSKMGILFKSTGAICVDRDYNPQESEVESIRYLSKGSAIGLFPEGTRNGLKPGKLEELYKLYDKEISYDEFRDMIGKKVLLSQILYIDELYKQGTLTLTQYKDAILDSKNYLLNLKENHIITNLEYDNTLLLPFKYGAVAMARKSKATIIPFAINGDYIKNSNNLVVRFGEPFQVLNDDLELENHKLRNNVLQLVKKNISNS